MGGSDFLFQMVSNMSISLIQFYNMFGSCNIHHTQDTKALHHQRAPLCYPTQPHLPQSDPCQPLICSSSPYSGYFKNHIPSPDTDLFHST